VSDERADYIEEQLSFGRGPGRRPGRLMLLLVGVVAVAVAIPLALTIADSHDPVSAARPTTPLETAPLGQLPGGVGWATEQAQIYAVAIDAVAPGRATVSARIRICRAPANRMPGQRCADGVIPIDVRRRIVALLGGRVNFVQNRPSPARRGDPPVIVLGRSPVGGATATLDVDVRCGPMCGQGETLVLSRSGGAWQVTGRSGIWVS
jgi:hypothetical protein